MKKVLILSTSPWHNSNSHALAEEFARGAKETGNDVEIISLRDKVIIACPIIYVNTEVAYLGGILKVA